MKKITTIAAALAVPLLLTACSGEAVTETTPAPVTVTETPVATTAKSSTDKSADVERLMRSQLEMYDVTEANLRNECIVAIDEQLPESGNFDFPTPIDFGEVDPSVGVYTAGGEFLYQDASHAWTEGSYFCTVHSENGTISEATAVAM